jgi:hypothetical protein
MTDDDLARVAHLPQRQAAAELGIPRSVLQRARAARNPVTQAATFAPGLPDVAEGDSLAR